jgi:DNA-binding ferritin-like protein
MKDIIVALKVLNLYAHNSHNLASRIVFNQDHEMLASIYEAADTNYDDVVERQIGLFGDFDIAALDLLAAQQNKALPQGADNAAKLKTCLDLEKKVCLLCEQLIKSGQVTVGTEQLLGNICDGSEVRQYKLSRRLMK